MAQAFFINPKGRRTRGKAKRRSPWARDWTGVHKKVGTVRAHKRHVNPTKRTNRRRGSAKRRRFSPAQLAAQRRFAAMARARAGTTRKARSVVSVIPSPRRTGGTMARRRRRRSAAGRVRRRRRRSTVYAANPRRRRRRSFRRNPSGRRRRRSYRRNPGTGFSPKGIIGSVVQGAKDGTAVVLGSAVTNLVAQRIPFAQTTVVGRAAVQLLVAAILAPIVGKITRSPRTASFFLAGGVSNAIRPAIAAIPVIGPAANAGLGVYPNRGVGAYPRAAGVGAYPRLSGWASAPQGGAVAAPQIAARGQANTGLDQGLGVAGQMGYTPVL